MKNFPLTEHSNITLQVEVTKGIKWTRSVLKCGKWANFAAWPPIAATTVTVKQKRAEWEHFQFEKQKNPKQTPLYVFMLAWGGIVGDLQKVYFGKLQPKHLFCIHISRLSVGLGSLGLDVAGAARGPTAMPDSSKADRVILKPRLHGSLAESPTITSQKSLTRVESRSKCGCCDGNKPAEI